MTNSKPGTIRRGRGRPAKLTLEQVEEVGQRIALGLTEEQACLSVGVNYQTFLSARKRKPEYALTVKKHRAVFLFRALSAINTGVKGWQGKAWILERCYQPQFLRAWTVPQEPAPQPATNGTQITPEVIALARQYAQEASRRKAPPVTKHEPNAESPPARPPTSRLITQQVICETDSLRAPPRLGLPRPADFGLPP